MYCKTLRNLLILPVLCLVIMASAFTAHAETIIFERAGGPSSISAQGWNHLSDGRWQYRDQNGNLIRSDWALVDGSWYLFGSDGIMLTGWQMDDGFWYLFDQEGHMLKGWQVVDDLYYYLTENASEGHPEGSCYINTYTPDGSVVDENGALTVRTGDAGRPNPYGYSCVEVDLTNQIMYCYIGEELKLTSPCVTGAPGHDTSVGTWKINFKEKSRYLTGTNDDGSKYKSWVDYWMPFHGGQGLHDASWRGNSHANYGGNIHYTNGSHGCVNLPPDVAAELYRISWVGMPVIVHM